MYTCPDCGKTMKTRGTHRQFKHSEIVQAEKPNFFISGDATTGGIKMTVVDSPEKVKVNLGEFYIRSSQECSCIGYAGQGEKCPLHKHSSVCTMCGGPHRYFTVDKISCKACEQVKMKNG